MSFRALPIAVDLIAVPSINVINKRSHWISYDTCYEMKCLLSCLLVASFLTLFVFKSSYLILFLVPLFSCYLIRLSNFKCQQFLIYRRCRCQNFRNIRNCDLTFPSKNSLLFSVYSQLHFWLN